MVESTSAPICYLRRENNPYHLKLEQFNDFVYLDHQAEANKGKWNEHIFKNSNPLIVEIGVGYGDFMTHYCLENPNHNYVGMDIRFKRSFGVAKKLQNNELKNVRFLRAQGQRLPWLFAPREVDLLFCFFPDPWPRKKQHKKRLFQKNLLDSLAEIIKINGTFASKQTTMKCLNGYFSK